MGAKRHRRGGTARAATREPARTSWLLGLALSCLALASGCGQVDAGPGPLIVFASSSLEPAVRDLAQAFEETHEGTRVEVHGAGTPRLLLQIEAGAPADVLTTADTASLEQAFERGLSKSDPLRFAHNRLALVVAPGNPLGLRRLADLVRPELRVGLCGPRVPAGRYARLVLDRAALRVQSRSDEASVRALTAKVALGELDAGIVYASEPAGDGVELVPLAAHENLETDCAIAPLATGDQPQLAERFVAFATSSSGRAVLERHGLTTP